MLHTAGLTRFSRLYSFITTLEERILSVYQLMIKLFSQNQHSTLTKTSVYREIYLEKEKDGAKAQVGRWGRSQRPQDTAYREMILSGSINYFTINSTLYD